MASDKVLILLAVFLIAAPISLAASSGLDCHYNENAILRQRIPTMERDLFEWLCEGDNISECVSYVTRGAEVLQTNPDPFAFPDYGAYNSFQAVGNGTRLVRIYFSSKELLGTEAYTFHVECSIDGKNNQAYYSVEFTPDYKTLDMPAYYLEDYGKFIDYIIGGSLFIVIVFLLLLLIWRASK